MRGLLLPFFLLLSLGACSRYIEGDVFLDKNANNIKDLDEPRIHGIQYLVSSNGSTLNSGLTDADGHYLVPLDSSKFDIQYCVSIETQGGGVAPKSSSLGKALEASTDQDDENDAESEGEEEEEEKDEDKDDAEDEEDSDACPKNSDDQPDCSDSRCAEEAACETRIVKSMQACDKTKASEWNMKLDVPVAVDYSSRIAKIEKTEQTVYVGDVVGLEIVFPKSCVFQPFTLPKALKVSLGHAYDPVTREVHLAQAVAERPSQLFYKDQPRFGHDELFTYLLPVEVTGDSAAEEEIQIQPRLKCPDGKEVASNLQVLYLKNAKAPPASNYELSSEIAAGCPELGESGVLSSLIVNKAGENLAESDFTLTISGSGNHLSLEDLPEYCHQVGPTVECDIAASSAQQLGLAFNFTISDSLPTPAEIVFKTKLSVAGSEFEAAPISCNYP